jgi:cyclic-di-GMP phosphodiesterase, flagellum assembly factor TipF
MPAPFKLLPSRQLALLTGVAGLFSGACALSLLPPQWSGLAALVLGGGGMLGAAFVLDSKMIRTIETLAAAIGEVKVRLAHTNIKLEALSEKVRQQPMNAADAAPARAAIAELTAEVGILGGIVRDVATAMAEHEDKLETLQDTVVQPAVIVPAQVPAANASPANPSEIVITALDRAGAVSGRSPELVMQSQSALQAEQIATDTARSDAILAAVSIGNIELYLQPIMELPQRRTIGYEALARLRLDATTLLVPAEFLGIVEQRGLGPSFDAVVLTRVLAVARFLKAKGNGQFVSCNICNSTWAEPRAVASLTRLFENYRGFADTLVIELPQRVFRALDPASLGHLGAISAAGYRFALDQVHDLRLDPPALADRGVRFVKVPVDTLTGADRRLKSADIALEDVGPFLLRAGIAVIAEKLSDRSVADAIEFDMALGQGMALGAPRPVRPEILADPEKAAAATAAADIAPAAPFTVAAQDVASIETGAPQAEIKPERLPFRSFLRRASA